MGFTFSHPALILPCRYLPRRIYSFTGLVAGSMVPDFEYFIRWSNKSSYSHTLPGIFWFDIPVAILISLLYHHIIRNPLIDNLPFFLKSRLWKFRGVNWLGYLKEKPLVVLFSVLVGTLSHLLWDGFTAISGFFVQRIPLLMTEIAVIAGDDLFLYSVIEYFSSMLGLFIVMYQLVRLPRVDSVPQKGNGHFWTVLLAIFVTLVLVQVGTGFMLKSFHGFIKKAISTALFSLFMASLYYRKKTYGLGQQP